MSIDPTTLLPAMMLIVTIGYMLATMMNADRS